MQLVTQLSPSSIKMPPFSHTINSLVLIGIISFQIYHFTNSYNFSDQLNQLEESGKLEIVPRHEKLQSYFKDRFGLAPSFDDIDKTQAPKSEKSAYLHTEIHNPQTDFINLFCPSLKS